MRTLQISVITYSLAKKETKIRPNIKNNMPKRIRKRKIFIVAVCSARFYFFYLDYLYILVKYKLMEDRLTKAISIATNQTSKLQKKKYVQGKSKTGKEYFSTN